ncbi:hypothetical protein [Methylobacterium indicum]|uniref:Uncharacterized protein n=1 Tax=Methylobacterium indicum TaxID=1775910 RepID=A0A8H8WST7_9HYPH|nr:hypothetical protein [Methylobacterium indicum]BCM83828.1 hypothetical protein mvi_22890 [Methylobacterium indicum]
MVHKIIRPFSTVSERTGEEGREPKELLGHNWKRDLARHQERIRRDGGKSLNERFKQIVPHSSRRSEIISEAFLYIMDHRCAPEEAVKEASKTASRFYAEELCTCEFNDAWMQMPDPE